MAQNRFDGRVAVVTGAANGIGFAITRRLLAEGARVVAADIDAKAARRLADESNAGDRLLFVETDVSSETSCRAAAETVDRRIGRVDILINNAGIFPSQAFAEMKYADWRRVLAVNLDGPFLMTQNFAPFMQRNKYGRIVNFASGTVWTGNPGMAHYIAAKSGVIGLSRCLARELGGFGITVNVVSPGLTSTDTVVNNIPKELIEERRSQRAIKRLQTADDLVGTVLFLASDDAAFVTGQNIVVDGGVVLH
ncbi:MAG: SDR family NAD(P)-dependent oxidoreductase [Alphaproteobacteria bacterium]